MRTPYPSAKLAREVASKLVDDIAKAVTTQIFVAHTATDPSDEEMEIMLGSSHFDHIWTYSHLPGLSPCGSCCPTCKTHTRRPPIGETCRSLKRNFSAINPAHQLAPSAGLA